MQLQILVVDDIAESRDALCAAVTALGHQARGADSGAGALALFQQQLPDLVLLDLLMPGMDGFEVTRRMRELSPARWLPVIVTSSLTGEQHFIEALGSGADDYLTRPVSTALLDAKLRHYGGVLALQQRLSTLAQRQSDILDNILDPVLTLDENGRINELNRSAHELADLGGQALLRGQHARAVFGVDLAQLLELREVQVRRVDGSNFMAEISASQWREMGRQHYTLVLHDLTRRRQLEQMKDDFLATVSHELRTPLTSVIGAVGLLAGGAAGALPASAKPLVDMAQRNAERLNRLVDDILDLTKLEGDRMPLQLREQPLAPLLREALQAAESQAQRQQVSLLAEGLDTPGLPDLNIDGHRILQVLGNLLNNAIKHSPPGQSVRLTLSGKPAGVSVTIRDRGPGIAPALRGRLFQKFAQGDSGDRRSSEGAGLGLYIAQTLAGRMGGHITVDEAGDGAAFSLHLPWAGSIGELQPVLIHVDRDLQNRQRVAHWLQDRYTVRSASSLAQARALEATEAIAGFIANPQDQGAADAFCVELRQLAAGRPMLLLGDSIDQDFCERVDLPWLAAAESQAEDLQQVLHLLLTLPSREPAP